MTPRSRGTLFVFAAAMLWSTGGIGIKAVAEPPLKITFYRCLFAAIVLLAVLGKRVWRRTWTSTPVFIAAIVSYACCLSAFVAATKWTTAANAIFLQYAGAVWVLLLSPIVLREPMRLRDAIAIAAALGGMALFFVGHFDTRGIAGNAMAVLSSIFFAGLILCLRRENRAAQSAVTWGNVLCVAATFPFIAPAPGIATRSSLLGLVFLGVVQVALAYIFFVRGLAEVTATQASLTGMIEPVANPLWVFLFLGERPSAFAIAGGAVVLAAIAWHTLGGGEPVAELPVVD